MYKKLLIPLILALVAALVVGGVAYAASPLPAGMVYRVGKVLSVEMATNTFKFETLSGVRYTIHVNSSMVYIGISGLEGLLDMDRLNLETRMLSNGTWYAERVRAIPESLEQYKEHGTVIGVSADSFSIMDSKNQTFVFMVTSKTRFSGQDVPHLRELKLGMAVTVTFKGEGTKMLQALNVHVVR
jgi:hypothetical protein